MEVREYQENGMNVRERWVDGELKGREEWPIVNEPNTQPISEVDLLKNQIAQMNTDFANFMDFYFQMNPEQV